MKTLGFVVVAMLVAGCVMDDSGTDAEVLELAQEYREWQTRCFETLPAQDVAEEWAAVCIEADETKYWPHCFTDPSGAHMDCGLTQDCLAAIHCVE